MYYRGTIVEGPKRCKPPRVVLDNINGRGMTLEDDLVPMSPERPKGGKNSLSN